MKKADKETLLAQSDFLSLHCPLSNLSRNFIDAAALNQMKKTAVLINVAGEGVVEFCGSVS
ncbi:NAD(P)-dependent oxidoreductase [Hungatella hathewayi]|uniref:NAD(P)-dependent oxidoreductase n=1 Tax=Hungatella hathewayi TaxID=154046 RepID=UPI003563BA29